MRENVYDKVDVLYGRGSPFAVESEAKFTGWRTLLFTGSLEVRNPSVRQRLPDPRPKEPGTHAAPDGAADTAGRGVPRWPRAT